MNPNPDNGIKEEEGFDFISFLGRAIEHVHPASFRPDPVPSLAGEGRVEGILSLAPSSVHC